MGDLLSDAVDWLSGQRKQFMSGEVEYHRGETVIQLSATFGHTQVTVADAQGSEVSVRVADFIVDAADLGLEPKTGDIIIANGQKYQTMTLADEVWRWSDPYQKTMRIHTQRIGSVSE